MPPLYETVLSDVEGLFKPEDEMYKEENREKTEAMYGKKSVGSIYLEKQDDGHVLVYLPKLVLAPLVRTEYETGSEHLAWGNMTLGPMIDVSHLSPVPVYAFHFREDAYNARKETILSLFRLTIDMHELHVNGLDVGV